MNLEQFINKSSIRRIKIIITEDQLRRLATNVINEQEEVKKTYSIKQKLYDKKN